MYKFLISKVLIENSTFENSQLILRIKLKEEKMEKSLQIKCIRDGYKRLGNRYLP